jgi:hypothetical protein
MVKAITEMVASLKSGDIAVLTFSGHGTYVPDKDNDEEDSYDEALCAHDIMNKQFLTDDELWSIFKKKKRGSKIIFISDSCHSGTVARDLNMPGIASPKGKPRFLDPSVFLSPEELNLPVARGMAREFNPKKKHTNTALLMSGCQEKEYSYDARINNRPNGAFTYNALKILNNLPPDANYSTWYKSIRSSLPSREYPQTPNFEGTNTQKKWNIFN